MNTSKTIRRWHLVLAFALSLIVGPSQAAQPLVVDPALWRDYLAQAQQGDATAQARMGHLYAAGQGVAQDWAESCRWYRASAEQGFAPGQTGLGTCYARGAGGLPANDGEAVTWYKKAADVGDAHGQTLLAQAYEAGKGVPANPGLALEYFRKAAQAGHPGAQAALGVMLASGRGTNADPGQARVWLQRSAAQGNQAAQAYLDKMGPATTADAQQARRAATARAVEYYRDRLSQPPSKPMPSERESVLHEFCGRDQGCWDRQQALRLKMKREKAEQEAQLAAERQAAQQEAQQAAELNRTAAAREVAAAPAARRILGIALESALPIRACGSKVFRSEEAQEMCFKEFLDGYRPLGTFTEFGARMNMVEVLIPKATKPDWLSSFNAKLLDGKVVAVQLHPYQRFPEARRAMDEKYGKSSETITGSWKNQYGTKWDSRRYDWRAGDVEASAECDTTFGSGCNKGIWILGPTYRALKAQESATGANKLKL